MKIAIVDDSGNDRALTCRLAHRYFEDRKEVYNISPDFEEFESGEDFLANYSPGKYALAFLDIYMNILTGIDVAKRIAALDRNCSIIFFTSSDEHQLEGYSVHAVGYIMKPVYNNLTALYKALDYAFEKLKLDKSGITLQSDFGELHLYFRNIMYMECIDRTVYIHLTDMVVKALGKYTDYQDSFLSESRFMECYRNLIVNMDYIETPDENDFILKSGEKIPISRRKKTNVIETYTTYFIKKRG